jgi:hypothetical protein
VRSPQEQRATLTLGSQITTLIGRETNVIISKRAAAGGFAR